MQTHSTLHEGLEHLNPPRIPRGDYNRALLDQRESRGYTFH